MGSYAYLCLSDDPVVCPVSFEDAVSVAGSAKYAVPVLWALMFSADDVRDAEREDPEGENIECWAPVARVEDALARLNDSVRRLGVALGGDLQGYARLLADEVRSHERVYVGLDAHDLAMENEMLRCSLESTWEGIAAIDAPLGAPKRGLRGLFSRAPKVVDGLCELSGLRPKAGLLDARCFGDPEQLTEGGVENHWALLGSGYDRTAAWEPEGITRGTARQVIADLRTRAARRP